MCLIRTLRLWDHQGSVTWQSSAISKFCIVSVFYSIVLKSGTGLAWLVYRIITDYSFRHSSWWRGIRLIQTNWSWSYLEINPEWWDGGASLLVAGQLLHVWGLERDVFILWIVTPHYTGKVPMLMLPDPGPRVTWHIVLQTLAPHHPGVSPLQFVSEFFVDWIEFKILFWVFIRNA